LNVLADNIHVLDRLDRPRVAKELLVHGSYYLGVVYTFYDAEGYGFIKSYGALENAKSYA